MNLKTLKSRLERERSARIFAEEQLAASNESLEKAVSYVQHLERKLTAAAAPCLSTDNKPMNEVSGKFRFDNSFNSDFLHEAYGDDLDHAVDMFETFLEVIDTEFKKLQEVADNNDLERAAKLCHKIKPLFTMVGLDKLTEDFEKLEKIAEANNLKNFQFLISQLDQEISNYVNLIKSETVRLQKHLV